MAKVQQFSNHARMRPVYHYVMAPLGFALAAWGTYDAVLFFSSETLFRALLGVAALLALYYPRVFALENQDRIIRMEMRYRFYLLTGKRLEPLERELGLKRIIALRFASDEELPALLEVTLKENLSAKDIKKRIANWQGDYYRV